jgi:hypothetical protein
MGVLQMKQGDILDHLLKHFDWLFQQKSPKVYAEVRKGKIVSLRFPMPDNQMIIIKAEDIEISLEPSDIER